MSASSNDQSSPGAAKPTSRLRHWLWAVVYLVTVVVLALHEGEHVIEVVKDADIAAGKFVESISISSLSEAFVDRFNSCEYHDLVICEPRQVPVCDVFCGESRGGIVMAAWTGLNVLPRLPDAIWYVLKVRFEAGDIGGFVAMLMWVAINLFFWVGALTEGSILRRAFGFLVSIVLVPLFLSLFFGIVQFLIVLLTGGIGLALQATLLIAGIPAAIMTALGMLHLGVSVREAFSEFVKAIRHPFG